jgi:hypothetical protein
MKVALPKLALLAFVAIPFSANASFEMMLIADNGSGLGQGHIKRFDPENGVYLGEFGRGQMGEITGVALDQARGRLFVAETTGAFAAINEFDYSTGAKVRVLYSAAPFKLRGMFIENGFLYGFDNYSAYADMFRYNLNTGAANLVTSLIISNVRDATMSNGFVKVAGSSGISSFSLLNPSGVVIETAGDYSAVTSGRWQNSSGVVNGLIAARTTGSILQFGTQATFTASGTKIAVAQSHNDVYTLYNASSGVFNVGRNSNWNPYPNYTNTVVASGYLTNPVDMAIVVAPEPGSMIALGAGVLALVRRRKSSASKA